MELLEFARGQGLQIAVSVFAAGLVWRLLHLYLTMRKTDLSAARQGGEKSRRITHDLFTYDALRTVSLAHP